MSPIMDITLTNVITTGFAAFALAVFLTGKDGPFKIFLRLRTMIGTPLQCFVCSAGFWCVLVLCAIDFTLIALLGTHPIVNVFWAGWLIIKFSLSGAGVSLGLLALAGRLNLDV